jgi:imidazolonepropionase-like amidohydrolase
MGPNGTTAIIGATALVGDELARIPDATILLAGRSIVAVGDAEQVPVPAGATEVRADGLTVLPGFIDAHVHIGFYPPEEVLRGGVTTVRDLAWPPERIWPLVADSGADDFVGPTIVATGQMLTVERGYPTRAAWAPSGTGRVVTGPNDAAVAVDEQADRGAVAIKVAMNSQVGPTFDRATLSAVVDAAHERGLKVTGHVHALSDLDVALDSGIDELAHMLLSGERLGADVLARMASQVVVVPTLSCFHGRARKKAIRNLDGFLEAGGRVVYGTDLGNEGPRPGIDEREITAMRDAGMPARDIIAAATTGAAAHLGLVNVGIIAPGFDADLIGVRGDPWTDAATLLEPELVVRRGRVL